jgi:hypothetical protein
LTTLWITKLSHKQSSERFSISQKLLLPVNSKMTRHYFWTLEWLVSVRQELQYYPMLVFWSHYLCERIPYYLFMQVLITKRLKLSIQFRKLRNCIHIYKMIPTRHNKYILLRWILCYWNWCVFSSPCQRQCELLPSLGVCHLLTFHILIFSSEIPLPNELTFVRTHLWKILYKDCLFRPDP